MIAVVLVVIGIGIPSPISIANHMGLFALGYANSNYTNATNIYTY